jgi:hypothetical protein
MTDIPTWSKTANNNNRAVPDGAPEGWDSPDVNDTIREAMRAIREWYDDPEWLNLMRDSAGDALTVTKESDTAVKIAGVDMTSFFPVGRSCQVNDGATSVEGTVVSAAFGTDTIVTLSLPLGTVVQAGANEILLFIIRRDLTPKVPEPIRNLLINGDFQVDQRRGGDTYTASSTDTNIVGMITNADGNYTLDRWVLLTDGADVVDVLRDTDPNEAKLTVVTAQKFAFLQILEASQVDAAIASGTVSLRLTARRTGASISTIKAAVIEWGGTRDLPTKDVVNVWGGTGVDPTLVTSWTYSNTPQSLATDVTNKTLTIDGISVSAGAQNLGVIIFIDSAAPTISDDLILSDVQLEASATANDFARRSFSEEYNDCCRYYEKSFQQSQRVGSGNDGLTPPGPDRVPSGVIGITTTGAECTMIWRYRVPKRLQATPPTVIGYNPMTTGNPTFAGEITDAVSPISESWTTLDESEDFYSIELSTTPTVDSTYGINFTADAELGV